MSLFVKSLMLLSSLLLVACPSTKNSSDVDQKNTFPTFSIFYSENTRITTAYAQVWENQRKNTTLRLTGSAALLFENQDMDLHDGSSSNDWNSELSGTYYRRSIYDLPLQPTYKFRWEADDAVSSLDADVKAASAPVLALPLQNMVIRRQEGIRIKIDEAAYRPEQEKISVLIEDERGNRIRSEDAQDLPQVGPNEYLLSGDRTWSLRTGKVFVTVTREVNLIERKSNGAILFETKASFEANKVAFTLVND